MHIYIYIYIEREREMYTYICMYTLHSPTLLTKTTLELFVCLKRPPLARDLLTIQEFECQYSWGSHR